ncbi:hypothetical protein [Chitinophaga rhizophila]|uniref:Uncharacterized protein n=1 Tax=Chitinophaga rhizophila TaxID=2866212 RepID=A0ABS7G7W7_9BACT|nr:hypothetical protein [Chitinophaga rhizophila]MBW8683757.1 hypothetical protein [Chitinophaga rhizophila]
MPHLTRCAASFFRPGDVFDQLVEVSVEAWMSAGDTGSESENCEWV